MTKNQEELRDILSKVLLDGQNQIHDLKDGKATPQEVTERMFKSLDYWTPKAIEVVRSEVLSVLDEVIDKWISNLKLKGQTMTEGEEIIIEYIKEIRGRYE